MAESLFGADLPDEHLGHSLVVYDSVAVGRRVYCSTCQVDVVFPTAPVASLAQVLDRADFFLEAVKERLAYHFPAKGDWRAQPPDSEARNLRELWFRIREETGEIKDLVNRHDWHDAAALVRGTADIAAMALILLDCYLLFALRKGVEEIPQILGIVAGGQCASEPTRAADPGGSA